MREAFFEFIRKIEKNSKPYLFEDIDLWPIIRNRLFYMWISEEYQSPQRLSNSRSSKISILLKGVGKLITVGRVDVLAIGNHAFRSNSEGISKDKFLDPILDEFELDYNILITESNYKTEKDTYKNCRILPLNLFYKIFAYFTSKKFNENNFLDQRDSFDTLINSFSKASGRNSQQVKRAILKEINKFLVWLAIYQFLFKKLKPRLVLTYNYPNLSSRAAIILAKKNNIKTIDIQHGTQGEDHISYNKFYRIPSVFVPIPDYFWVWDEHSAAYLKTKMQHDKIIVGGNPWHKFALNSTDTNSTLAISKVYKVLYTLQPITPILEDFILRAIELSDLDVKWYIRYHPRMNKGQIHLIENKLKAFVEQGKVELKMANDISLPLLFQHMNAHISKFSSSIIEAAMFGVPSIVIHDLGKKMYSHSEYQSFLYFQEKTTGEEILEIIERIKNRGDERNIIRNEIHDRFIFGIKSLKSLIAQD